MKDNEEMNDQHVDRRAKSRIQSAYPEIGCDGQSILYKGARTSIVGIGEWKYVEVPVVRFRTRKTAGASSDRKCAREKTAKKARESSGYGSLENYQMGS